MQEEGKLQTGNQAKGEGGPLGKQEGNKKKTRAIASHDAQQMLSITLECSESCRIADDTIGKGYSSKQSPRQQTEVTGIRSPRETRRGLKKNASDSEP